MAFSEVFYSQTLMGTQGLTHWLISCEMEGVAPESLKEQNA